VYVPDWSIQISISFIKRVSLVKIKIIFERLSIDGHENDDIETKTASMLKLSFDSKGYDVKIDLVCLTSLLVQLFTLSDQIDKSVATHNI